MTIQKHQRDKTDQQRKYLWLLIRKITTKIKNGQSENDIYCEILRMAGISEWIALPEEQVHLARSCYRIVEDRGPSVFRTLSGREISVRQLQCWKGLSKYSAEEARVLIDAAIEKCNVLGITIDTPDKIPELKQKWGVDTGPESIRL